MTVSDLSREPVRFADTAADVAVDLSVRNATSPYRKRNTDVHLLLHAVAAEAVTRECVPLGWDVAVHGIPTAAGTTPWHLTIMGRHGWITWGFDGIARLTTTGRAQLVAWDVECLHLTGLSVTDSPTVMCEP